MARLPTVGGDENEWGAILNDFLLQSHTSSGSLKDGVMGSSNISTNNSPSANSILLYDGSALTWSSALGDKANDTDVVHNTGAETIAGVKTFSSSPIVPDPTTTGQATSKDYVDSFTPAVTTVTSDQASTSATYADITGLALAVNVGTYAFHYFIPYTGSSSNNSGIKIRLNGPTNSFLSYSFKIQSTRSTEKEFFHDTFADETIGDVIFTAGDIYMVRVRGLVISTASGTLQPQFGIVVGGTTTTVKAGTFGKLQKIS